MHTATQLQVELFAVRRSGRPATRDDLLPHWAPHDRLGVVMLEPFGAIGASHLIQLAITAFYDVRPRRRAPIPKRPEDMSPDAVYPEIYLFHVGAWHGDHSVFDFWPARKEVLVDSDPRAVLDAINSHAITRLAVPDGEPTYVEHELKEPAAARDRIVTALAYSPTGSVREPTWELTGLNKRTEANVIRILDPENRYSGTSVTSVLSSGAADDPDLAARSWAVRTQARLDEARDGLALARTRRDAMRGPDGLASETYRDLTIDEALQMLV